MKHNYKLSPKDDYAGVEQSIIREKMVLGYHLKRKQRLSRVS